VNKKWASGCNPEALAFRVSSQAMTVVIAHRHLDLRQTFFVEDLVLGIAVYEQQNAVNA
jgi:hypothetical protein